MFRRGVLTQEFIRVLSIDPSTTNMGVCIIDIPLLVKSKLKLVYVNTIFGEQVKYDIPNQFNDTVNGTGVLARSYGMARSLKDILNIYEPDVVICEDNFLGPSPGTFKQLIQAVSLLREACNQAEKSCHLSYVIPMLAKATVGAAFKGTTKDDVKAGVIAYENLDHNNIDLETLDEHSADACAIGLYQCEMILEDLQVPLPIAA